MIDVFVMILNAILDSLPETEVPDWIGTGAGFIPSIFTFAASMGVWFPFGLLGIVLTAVVATWLASFGIKLARIIISHVTGGGGGAG